MPFDVGMEETVVALLLVLLMTGRVPDVLASVERGIRSLRRSASSLHYGAAVRTLLARAETEAVRFQHACVRTDHLLLALTLEPDPTTERVLGDFQVRLDDLRWRLKETLVLGDAPVVADVPFSAATKQVLRLAMSEAEGLGHPRVDPVHVLLGLLDENDAPAAVLGSFGISAEGARAATATASGR